MSALALGASAQPTPFNFGERVVRVIVRDGEPWFVASDVCAALGYRDAEKGTRILGTHQKADTQIVGISSNGTEQTRRVTIINESGLYRLVLRSRKPEALAFSKWVTGEVLPSIRKTGGYVTPKQASAAPSLLGRRWLVSYDLGGERVQEVSPDACVMRPSDWPRLIADPGFEVGSAELLALAQCCLQRLSPRLGVRVMEAA